MAVNTTKESDNFTALDALKLVALYFDTEWPATQLKDVQLRKVTGGFVNRLHLITRTNYAELEPAAVLIRHFGLGSSFNLSRNGTTRLGPKVYGFFPGGRLEEYIDAHPLTADEACEPAISEDLARNYARLHSVRLPFRKRNFHLVAKELRETLLKKKNSVVEKLERSRSPDSLRLASTLHGTAWRTELDWVIGLFEEHQCKATLAIGDTNFLNVLVKNLESECQAMLIDYKICTHSYRGIDIGGHFNERMYCWSNPETNLTGHDAPDTEEQLEFCRSYLDEMRLLGQEMGPNDTEEHLLFESKIGRMWQLLFSVVVGFVSDATGTSSMSPTMPRALVRMEEFTTALAAAYQMSLRMVRTS